MCICIYNNICYMLIPYTSIIIYTYRVNFINNTTTRTCYKNDINMYIVYRICCIHVRTCIYHAHDSNASRIQLNPLLLRGYDSPEQLHLRQIEALLTLMRWPRHVYPKVSIRLPTLHLEVPKSGFRSYRGIVAILLECSPSRAISRGFESPVPQEMVLVLNMENLLEFDLLTYMYKFR